MERFDDGDDFVVFGTALEPIEEDDNVRKKPISIQDQVVLDENGRRRFHGAFTGGFSAGYYNTVGSKEGWAPSSFKSTRNDRSASKVQSVQDYMDEEDLGAFGIAPQVLRPTEDFQSKRREGLKRPRPTPSDGPIPGDPVLFKLLQPAKETIGIKVLRKMGWRPGQGIGAKVYKKSKLHERDEDAENIDEGDHSPPTKMYGCALPPSKPDTEADSSDEEIRTLLVAPDEVTNPLYTAKENTFGLGYSGLDKNAIFSGHVDLFGPSLKFKVDDRKMNITGEAFGIGVFEEADEEVYSREDMTQYDFALETPQERKRRLLQEARDKRSKKQSDAASIAGFIQMKHPPKPKKFPRPQIPKDFLPVHAQKKSRFSKDEVNDESVETRKLGLDRHQLSRQERHVLLEGEKDLSPRRSQMSTSLENIQNKAITPSSGPPFGIAQTPEDQAKDAASRVERLKKFTDILQKFSSQKPPTLNASFKPFMKHPGKQERYENYVTLKAAGYSECLKDLQPTEMTEWERDREKVEFERASALYKPMSGEMSSRFISAKSHDISHMVPEREREMEKDPSQDPKVAAKMNLFGKLTHEVLEWHPDRLVCKRFNVPPPYPDSKMVGVRSGTSGRKEPELQESISKKSLFEDLDFSKPPPGLVPVASQLPEATETASTTASSQPQLEFLSTQPVHSPSGEISSTETTSTTKPPLDLFKEIFADSSESENEGVEQEKQPHSTKTKSIDRELSNEGENGENRKKSDDKKITREELMPGQQEKNRSGTEKVQSQEENRGIFTNLDFSKLSSNTSTVSTSGSNKRNEEDRPRRLSNILPVTTSSIAMEEDDTSNDETAYGPAPPSSLPSKKPPKLEFTSSQSKTNSNNYSSISNPERKAAGAEYKEEGIVWVEKDAPDSSSKSKKKHVKKHHKSHHHRRSSKSKKGKKHKSSSKHKSKKHKRKTSKDHSRSKSGHDDKSGSSSSGSELSDSDNSDSDQANYPSVSIYNSENSKALIAKLKEMI